MRIDARFILSVGVSGLVAGLLGGYGRGRVNNPCSVSIRIPRSASRLSFRRTLLTLLGAISRLSGLRVGCRLISMRPGPQWYAWIGRSADGLLVMTAYRAVSRVKKWCVCLVRNAHGMIAGSESDPWPRQLIPLLCIPTLL